MRLYFGDVKTALPGGLMRAYGVSQLNHQWISGGSGPVPILVEKAMAYSPESH
jgi:hypothetical protein